MNIRHRPQLSERVEGIFSRFVSDASLLPSPWGIANPSVVLPPLGTALCQILQLRGKLGKGISGRIKFSIRAENYLVDHASIDDSLHVEFDQSKAIWKELTDIAFPCYVRALGAYSGSLRRDDEPISYWRRIVEIEKLTGLSLDGRDGFFRFGPINFMDRELCRRGCNGQTPEQIVVALADVVPEARLFDDGVIIVAADHFPEQEEIGATDRAIRKRLGLSIWADE